MGQQGPNVLDYGREDPPPPRRDAIEYYREPPALASWTIGGVFLWVLAFVAVLAGVVYTVGYYFAKAWQ